MQKLKLIHPKLNAYTFSFDENLMDEIRQSYENELEPLLLDSFGNYKFAQEQYSKIKQSPDGDYFLLHFDYYPTIWVSNNSARTFKIFQNFYQQLDIHKDLKEILDFNHNILMYSGFFVIGNQSPVELWHQDYLPKANSFTMITPLYGLSSEHGNLLYKVKRNDIRKYQYKSGEAILIGDNFLHTTEPYKQTDSLRVLLSLTVGTDKLKYWPRLKVYMKTQSDYFMLPCGHINGSCQCLDKFWNPFKVLFRFK